MGSRLAVRQFALVLAVSTSHLAAPRPFAPVQGASVSPVAIRPAVEWRSAAAATPPGPRAGFWSTSSPLSARAVRLRGGGDELSSGASPDSGTDVDPRVEGNAEPDYNSDHDLVWSDDSDDDDDAGAGSTSASESGLEKNEVAAEAETETETETETDTETETEPSHESGTAGEGGEGTDSAEMADSSDRGGGRPDPALLVSSAREALRGAPAAPGARAGRARAPGASRAGPAPGGLRAPESAAAALDHFSDTNRQLARWLERGAARRAARRAARKGAAPRTAKAAQEARLARAAHVEEHLRALERHDNETTFERAYTEPRPERPGVATAGGAGGGGCDDPAGEEEGEQDDAPWALASDGTVYKFDQRRLAHVGEDGLDAEGNYHPFKQMSRDRFWAQVRKHAAEDEAECERIDQEDAAELEASGKVSRHAWRQDWLDENGFLNDAALEPGSAFLRENFLVEPAWVIPSPTPLRFRGPRVEPEELSGAPPPLPPVQSGHASSIPPY